MIPRVQNIESETVGPMCRLRAKRRLHGAIGVENERARFVHHVLVILPKTETQLPRQRFGGFRGSAQEMPIVPVQAVVPPVLAPVGRLVVLRVVADDDEYS